MVFEGNVSIQRRNGGNLLTISESPYSDIVVYRLVTETHDDDYLDNPLSYDFEIVGRIRTRYFFDNDVDNSKFHYYYCRGIEY